MPMNNKVEFLGVEIYCKLRFELCQVLLGKSEKTKGIS